jgi:Cytochrome c7 and related cytochrome c/Class III cytochrome C family
MSQVFHRSTNVISKVSAVGAVILIGAIFWFMDAWSKSGYNTQAFVSREQPVQFSHKHHAGDDGIDCRYCHTSVEVSASAGIPPTKTCMNCHAQIWSNAPYLEPVRESFRTGEPIKWVRVHDLPDFVYFNHSIHVNKGVGCSTCHGRVDQMPLMMQVQSLQMQWCIDCHRSPEQVLRPKNRIFDMSWEPGPNQAQQGKELAENVYHLQNKNVLTSCSTCHR